MNVFLRQEHDLPFPDSKGVERTPPVPGQSGTPGQSGAPEPNPSGTPGQSNPPGQSAPPNPPNPPGPPSPPSAPRRHDPPGPEAQPIPILTYLDVVLVVLAAPIMILIGVSAGGYAIGAGAWVLLRAIGVGVERVARVSDARTQISLRMGYMLGRLFGLAIAVILARQNAGEGGGLAALAVIVFAFTVQLGTSAISRPRSR